MNGGSCQPDLLYSAVRVEDLDALVFVGGVGASEYFPDRTAHRLAQEAAQAEKLLGAICFASSTLANAGVLEGLEATCFPSREAHLRSKGALPTGAPVTTTEKATVRWLRGFLPRWSRQASLHTWVMTTPPRTLSATTCQSAGSHHGAVSSACCCIRRGRQPSR